MAFDRHSLGGSPFEYSNVNFLTQVEPMLPYSIIDGRVAQHHTKGPHKGAQYPPNVSTTESDARLDFAI